MNVPRTHATTPRPGNNNNHQDPNTQPNNQPTLHPNTQPHNQPTKKPQPGSKFTCTEAGFFSDPSNPRKFHQCVNFGTFIKDYEFYCPDGTKYDDRLHICD